MGMSVIADLAQELVPELQTSILGFLLGVVSYALFQKVGHCIFVSAKSLKDPSRQVVDNAEAQTSSADDFGEWEHPAKHTSAVRRDGEAESPSHECRCEEESPGDGRPREESVPEEQPVARSLCKAGCVQPEEATFEEVMDMLWGGLTESSLQEQPVEPLCTADCVQPEAAMLEGTMDMLWEGLKERIDQDDVDGLYKRGTVDEPTRSTRARVPLAKPSWFHEEQGHLRDACPEPVEALHTRRSWFDETEQVHLKGVCSEPAEAKQPSPVRRTRRSWSDETDWSGETEQEHLKEEAAEVKQRVHVRQARRSWYATTVQEKGDEAPWLARLRSTGTPAPRGYM